MHEKGFPSPETYSSLLRVAKESRELGKWVDGEFEKLCQANPDKEHWDVIFQWAVISLGKGVEDIRHMIETMHRHSEGKDSKTVDIATINGLIQAATEATSPFLAERFLEMGLEMGLEPDYQTYILQLQSRLSVGDLIGARSAFDDLQAADRPDDVEGPVVNAYLRALCQSAKPNTEMILDILGVVEQNQTALESATVLDLCLCFLEYDLQYDVIDTLSLHTVQLSIDQRKVVRDGFVEYCLLASRSTQRVWDGYSLLRQFFPETEPESRTQIMEAFFKRRRPDMAAHVFGHMRAHTNNAIRPTRETYTLFFESLARCTSTWRNPDGQSLKIVHNMLKMDTTIQPNTKLYNALMLACAACGDEVRAQTYWQAVSSSAEGPSYNSLAIYFWACSRDPLGDEAARQVWAKLQRMELEVPRFVFNQYCRAIAAVGQVDAVKELISGSQMSVGYDPDIMT